MSKDIKKMDRVIPTLDLITVNKFKGQTKPIMDKYWEEHKPELNVTDMDDKDIAKIARDLADKAKEKAKVLPNDKKEVLLYEIIDRIYTSIPQQAKHWFIKEKLTNYLKKLDSIHKETLEKRL